MPVANAGEEPLKLEGNKPFAVSVRIEGDRIWVRLNTGEEIPVPLDDHPKLRGAAAPQLESWRLLGEGVGIHWHELDEDVSVSSLTHS